MSIFHQNQEDEAHKIIDGFLNQQPFTVLVAQMQSGKSGTYLFTALEMVRLGVVEHFYIICGSSDVSLREQVKLNLEEAKAVFSQYFAEGEVEKARISEASFGVFFSQDMKKAPKISEKTLIVHDESHMAQSKNNIPFKQFYKRNNIDRALFGDFTQLREKNNYILGVSATPFSELVTNKKVRNHDWTDEEEDLLGNTLLDVKNLSMMEPGQGYIGIYELIQAGSIMFEAENIKPDECSHISSVLRDNFHKYSKKYVIIRTHRAQADADMIKTIASSFSYKYVSIFGGGVADINIADLEKEPDHPTIIHICGRFRMGQVLPKRHIGMVYEQSKNPKADTTLQGLVGRMCGYQSEGAQTNVDIYVSSLSEGSIRIYESAWSDLEIDSLTRITEAMNLGGVRRKNKGAVVTNEHGIFIKTVPIKFRLDQIDGNAKLGNIQTLDLINLFTDDEGNISEMIRDNPDSQAIMDRIETIQRIHENPRGPFHRNKHTENNAIYEEAFQQGKRENNTKYHRNTDCCFSLHCGDKKTCYLVGFLPYDSSVHPEINEELAQVDPRCNYIPGVVTHEDDSVLLSTNGGQIIGFPAETFDNHEIFKQELQKAILRTIPTHRDYITTCSNSICSLYDKKTQKYVGISLDPSVYTDERINKLTEYFERTNGVALKFSKSRGRQSVHHTRYASISW